MRRRWLLVAVILTAAPGCDNVSWGGGEISLQEPTALTPPDPAPEAPAESLLPIPDLPARPVLLAGARDGDKATLVVVGEVAGDALLSLPGGESAPGFLDHFSRTLLAPGTEVALFAEGVRVGRMTVAETSVDERHCTPRAQVTGTVELIPGASGASRLLGLTGTDALQRPLGTTRGETPQYEHRVGALAVGMEAIRQVGAAWPESLVESRADIQVLRLPEEPGPTVVATFMFSDRLAVGAPQSGAYSLFVMGAPEGGSYRSVYAAYRPVVTEGKGAPRYLSHLDLNGDGSTEILLDVFGNDTRWFASLARRGGSWVRTFQDPCGAPAE